MIPPNTTRVSRRYKTKPKHQLKDVITLYERPGLENGAELEFKDNEWGRTPLSWAAVD
jgi:hypothetical protein